jgi:hypothetical protein
MNKLLAVVFSEEKAAYEGVQALSALDREGSIRMPTAPCRGSAWTSSSRVGPLGGRPSGA